MDNLNKSVIQRGDKIVERKICYDTTVVEHSCTLLKAPNQYFVLFHKIIDTFTMIANQTKLTIPKGSYTIAYYWENRPYNLYIWRNEGNYLGSYFKIVKNTYKTDKLLSFEEWVIDIMVLPNGDYFILDEDELPEPWNQFEDGAVQQVLNSLTDFIDTLLPQMVLEADKTFKHKDLLPWLKEIDDI